ncbi:PACE efflux transporter [Xylophilus rhododendri]|uniref:PACE efflux transporter n=1 Tax=Xylophilus rhododendri TaxID=2697032 RepID=A0A857JDS1_9BURK|nr:PACE efflux transporter [Xylophilus rhododendri]QHJ01103.1 PACE efflux transporter [Xylophilus rhododendri]
MQGIWRRVVFVGLYEGIAIVCTSFGLSATTGGEQQLGRATLVAVACSVVAVLWNLVFNMLFERWEAGQAKRGRSLARRVAHAVGFEGGLALMLIPLVAFGLGVSIVQAFWLDIGLLCFFLVYTFVFNWAFDRIFGLPASAA